MGYAVQVDPDVLETGARRLAAAAESLDAVAARVLALCSGAGAAAGATELALALDEVGRTCARAAAQGAEVVGLLGTRTAEAGQEYRLLELALTGRLADPGGGR